MNTAVKRLNVSPLPVPGGLWDLMRSTVESFAIARVIIPGEPASKSRARFTKKYSKVQAYTPEKTKQAEAAVAWSFRKARSDWQVDQDGTFGVLAQFWAQTFQRRDVDNMLKLVMDGLTGVVWEDDAQVAEVSGRVVRGSTEPRTEFFVYYAAPNGAPPTNICENCGRRFRVYDSWKKKRYCKSACQDAVTRKARTRSCKGCGGSYAPGAYEKTRLYCSTACRQRTTTTVGLVCVRCGQGFRQWTSWRPTGAVLCSRDCSVAYWRENGTKYRKGSCASCGAPTSRKEAVRCRACARAERPQRARAPKALPERHLEPPRSTTRYPKAARQGTPEWDRFKSRALAFLSTVVPAGGNPSFGEIGQAIDLPAHGAVRLLIEDLKAEGWISRQKIKPFRFAILRPVSEAPSPNEGESS